MKTIHNVPPCAAGVPGEENKPHQLCAKSPGIERSPPGAGLCSVPLHWLGLGFVCSDQARGFGFVSFLQLQYKWLLVYTSVNKRTVQTFKKKSSLENSLD